MLIKIRSKSRIVRCLGCDNPLGMLEVLLGHRFCSTPHERAYVEKVNAAALVRLQEVEERLNSVPSGAEPQLALDTFPLSGG